MELNEQVSLEELESAMLSLKTGVAPGGDGFSRQNFLLLMMLYVMFLEPLVERLRRGLDFLGLHIPGVNGVRTKVSATLHCSLAKMKTSAQWNG